MKGTALHDYQEKLRAEAATARLLMSSNDPLEVEWAKMTTERLNLEDSLRWTKRHLAEAKRACYSSVGVYRPDATVREIERQRARVIARLTELQAQAAGLKQRRAKRNIEASVQEDGEKLRRVLRRAKELCDHDTYLALRAAANLGDDA